MLKLWEFRQAAYKCLCRAKDATFELMDAIFLTRNAYSLAILLVERLLEDGSPRVLKPMWLAFVGEEMPPLSELWKLYLRRFAVDHWYRFLKQRLHWTLPKLSTPQRCDRWSDLMPLITWELWLARDIVNCLSASVAEADK
ncbi:hypothetical protein [Nostoc sp.]|uniref:hypothetical protein n=1 Tax=Nostoc sp. TaxID=1180 RepID=UPI002FF707B8